MTLWRVEDEAAVAWIEALYRARFQESLSTQDAVVRASRRVLDSKRRAGKSTHPFYWGAFVAAGGN